VLVLVLDSLLLVEFYLRSLKWLPVRNHSAVITSHTLFINLFTTLCSELFGSFGKDRCVFLKQKKKYFFTDKSVDSVVMVWIHEPLWLYKYISSNFGKKRRNKTTRFQTCGRVSFSVIELGIGLNVCHVWTRDMFGTCNLYCG